MLAMLGALYSTLLLNVDTSQVTMRAGPEAGSGVQTKALHGAKDI